MERTQATTLVTGDVSAFSTPVDWTALAAHQETPEPLVTGYSNRWFASSLEVGKGVIPDAANNPAGDLRPNYLGRVQPYCRVRADDVQPGLGDTDAAHLDAAFARRQPQPVRRAEPQVPAGELRGAAVDLRHDPRPWPRRLVLRRGGARLLGGVARPRCVVQPRPGTHRAVGLLDGRLGRLQARPGVSRSVRQDRGAGRPAGVRHPGRQRDRAAGRTRSVHRRRPRARHCCATPDGCPTTSPRARATSSCRSPAWNNR